ncbi:hypothetical protein M9H77_04254 [Catharanthus roseus]|uniref:Uncharacterized protein n=1 Tax=Catharanthus roseus TaxID=4058 RepID=A0ACC0CDN0_CATRO|nr:hypothetical protein M9H77_04254 [Catharanthus roseus]
MPEEINLYCEMIIVVGPNFIPNEETNHEDAPNPVAKKLFDMLKAIETPLVESDEKHSMLFACVELLCIKPENQLTQKLYDDILGSLVHESCSSEELDIVVEIYFEEVKNDETEIEWDSDKEIDEDSNTESDNDMDGDSNT